MNLWSHGLRRQSVVQTILRGVFEGRYRSGQRLVVQKLADEFGVSPTPIREALVELAGIGIVDLLPNRGAVVRQVTWNDVAELGQIRRVLEAEAARTAVGKIDPTVLQPLVDELARLVKTSRDDAGFQLERFVEDTRRCDSRLHDLISTGAASRRLAGEIGRYRMLFRAFRDVSYDAGKEVVEYEHMLQENMEHLSIASALAAGDGRAAAKAMSKHIDAVMQFWGQKIVDALTPPQAPAKSR